MAQEGYAKIASTMSHHGELAIFRRFSKINFQNLLYLQAELTHLERDLHELVERDKVDPTRSFYPKDWWSLAESSVEEEGQEQWEKVLQIREKLKEYSTVSRFIPVLLLVEVSRCAYDLQFPTEDERALLTQHHYHLDDHLAQQVFLTSLRPPKAYDLNFFRSWLRRPKMGNFPLRGPDQDTWTPQNEHDLLAIQRRSSRDPLSRWITNSIIPYFHKKIFNRFKKPLPEDPESEICLYKEGVVANVMHVINTVVASMLPIASIIILYFVSNTLDRLAIAVAFTGLFAFCLAITTRARQVEIFAATSAFAAVQVVFVTGNSGYMA